MPPPVHHRVDTDPATGAPVLVKTATDAPGRARLADEADRLRSLGHLAVVRPVAHHDDGEQGQLLLAWVGPHSLATVAGLSPESSAALVGQVAETVAGLHAEGLVHGAVRPDHVLLAADGTPVLTGLAHAARVGATGPSGAAVAPADDVAALGALLVELVQPSDPGALVPERRGRRRRDAGTRGVLLTLADRATADDPAARPSATALAADLRRLAPGPVRPTGGPPPATAGRTRVAAAATLVALVGATAAAAAWLAGPTPDAGRAATPTTAPPRPSSAPGPATTAVDPRRPRAEPPRSPTTAGAPSTGGPAATAPPPTAPPPSTTSPDRTCPPAAPPAADIDGDDCPDALRIEGERVTAGATTWVVGRVGDRAAVADWDCDGRATVALLRPRTGEVFVFGTWARPGAEVTVDATTVVAGAERLAPDDPDGDGCPSLVAHRAGRPPVTIALRSDR